MHLIALLCQDPQLAQSLVAIKDARFLLHAIPIQKPLAKVFTALEPLDFAGALVLGNRLETEAFSLVNRSSLDAQETQMIDTVTVSPGGLLGEYNFGRAIGAALRAGQWDARNARSVILGSGPRAKATARELSSLGSVHISLLAQNRPAAEKALPKLALNTRSEARAIAEASAASLLEQADVLVRIDEDMDIPYDGLLGPHLSVIDLSESPLSDLRKHALKVGAKTLGLRDIQAYQLSISLGHMLGGVLDVEGFLDLLHTGVGV